MPGPLTSTRVLGLGLGLVQRLPLALGTSPSTTTSTSPSRSTSTSTSTRTSTRTSTSSSTSTSHSYLGMRSALPDLEVLAVDAHCSLRIRSLVRQTVLGSVAPAKGALLRAGMNNTQVILQ